MEQTVKRILKSGDIELGGKFHLDAASVQHNHGKPRTVNGAAAAGVKIIENNPDFAVIEFACACGLKTLIKCQYAAQNT